MLSALLLLCKAATAQPVQSFPEPSARAPESPQTTVPPAPVQPAPAPGKVQPPVSPQAPEPTAAVATGPMLPGPAPQNPISPPAAPELSPTAPTLGFFPAVLPYREGVPTPPGYRLEVNHNAGLAFGGTVTLILAYVAGVGLAVAQKSENGTSWLFVPVVGPWAAIGAREITCQVEPSANDCLEVATKEISTATFLALDGLIQVTGAALTLVGLLSKQRQFVRMDVGQLRLRPLLSANGQVGLGATGEF